MTLAGAGFCGGSSISPEEHSQSKVYYWDDAAEVLRILADCDSKSRKHYPNTLFGSGEAFVGPCTAKTTIYCANIAAGLMVAQFTRYLRQLPIDCDIQLNLLASELTVGGGR
jgi:sulfur carrier protein ThiS adenylyltransferase